MKINNDRNYLLKDENNLSLIEKQITEILDKTDVRLSSQIIKILENKIKDTNRAFHNYKKIEGVKFKK